ncbi:MAG: ABC transporter ATP-binding protein [Erysipelotrichaceae bacterium]|nr:ABC transporter ATP-binding protein [Erysipelotrichaceae bacterium]
MKIVLDNLTKIFYDKKNNSEVHAIEHLSVEIPDGKLVGLLGPSGCGKSTTLYCISGLQTPTEGKVYFGEDDVTDLTADKRGIGLVFQNYALYPHMTVAGNIMFPLLNLKYSKEDAYNRALEVAKLVQLENHMDRKPSELSGGQQQRVAIARALAKNPNVLLLDEPLSNLDARLRLQTREEIKRIQLETGVTTIFVTHDQEEAMSISDYIILMKDGVMQQMDKPQNVYDNPCNLFVAKFLGTPPINVFEGRIEDKKVYIGDEVIMDINSDDKKIYVGIRPEGFIVDKKGKLTTSVKAMEVMGRDVSILANHPNSLNETIRIIISTDNKLYSGNVKFNLKPNKVLLFDYETEERIYVDGSKE